MQGAEEAQETEENNGKIISAETLSKKFMSILLLNSSEEQADARPLWKNQDIDHNCS